MTKMRSSATGVLLMLSLVVVLHADATEEQAAIRLPSDDFVQVMAPETEERPWECCDRSWCSTLIPQRCRCWDTVYQCAAACKQCVSTGPANPDKHICMDAYTGPVAPTCSKLTDDIVNVHQATATEVERPWSCCTRPFYTSTSPPICRCVDLVRGCHPACKVCRPIFNGLSMCYDSYHGDAGPAC